MNIARSARVALIAAASIGSAPAAAADGGAFVESFARLDDARWYVSDGWTNGPHQGCVWKARQARVTDGRLVLEVAGATAKDGDKRPAVCGEVQTRRPLGHGLYEASVRIEEGSGVVFGFFTYTGPVHGNPHDEIDIEILGRAPGTLEANYFVGGVGEHSEKIALPVPADTDFVHVGFEWRDGAIRWYVDGAQVRTVTAAPLPSHDARLFFSLWNGTEASEAWLGAFDAESLPVAAEVDWVGFTPAGERCAFPQSMSCRSDWVGGATP
jgi:endo-1,3-1,4-beta-glycanase ExoK